MDYLVHNKALWNRRTETHWTSEFYDVKNWLAGNNDNLREIERSLLEDDLSGQKLIHFQCHFGQDTLSLARMGANVTGVDLSDQAIERAGELAKLANLDARFIQGDIYTIKDQLADEKETFDIVYTTFGTIGWLPDLDRWAEQIDHCLKPGGQFIFAEFHPFIWTLNEARNGFEFSYFKGEAIIEEDMGSYTENSAHIKGKEISWNHSLGEVFQALTKRGLQITSFDEYDFSPWNCFPNSVETGHLRYQFKGLEGMLPITYSLSAKKPLINT